ncbi:MAG: hypothetical protein CME62_07720 [Halobacteriovoraceae bacterium]|nr:hypothetical protein [Halobacteriovoraceae bacterium]|tara:strand:- start:3927 stop:4781 length:855 start_codon:yes stop_codon:yes gene_type:complete
MKAFLNKITFTLFFILFSLSSFAHTQCKMPKDEVLTIGCSYGCKYFYRKALYRFANKKGYKLKLVDMLAEKNTNFDELDGIVMPGGADINPEYYKNKVEDDLRTRIEELDYLVDYSSEGDMRDPFEYEMLQRYFSDDKNKDLPILGICRGMQMLAVSQGIPLIVDIKEEIGIKNRRYLLDRVYLNDEPSLIKSILKYSSFRGYKYHHQGIRVDYFKQHQAERWPDIKLTAYSNRGRIAEAMEFEGRPILGTQFHPEIDFWTERKRIFSWLLDQSCENHNKKRNP